VSPEHLAQGLQLERPTTAYYKTSSRSSEKGNIFKQNTYRDNTNNNNLDLQQSHHTQATLNNNAHYMYRKELGPRALYDENIATLSRKQIKIASSKEDTGSASRKSYANLEGRLTTERKTNFLPARELTSDVSKKFGKSHEVSGRIQVPATKESSKNVGNLYSITNVNTEFTDTKQHPLLTAGGENGHLEMNPWTAHESYKKPDQFRFHRTHFSNIPSKNEYQNNGKHSEYTSQIKRHAAPLYAPLTNELNWKAPINYPIETNTTTNEQTHSTLAYPHQENNNAYPIYNQYQSYYNQHSQPSPPTYNHQPERHSQPNYYSTVPSYTKECPMQQL
jgi:hypothetical protein